MKVVLFCGGQGMRIREYSDLIPKPMVPLGYRPLIWHVMKYYAHYGHKDFVLCLGYRGDVIKNYFRNYDECLSNDFTLRRGGTELELLNSDIQDWSITFVDTGLTSNVGMRLKAVEKHIGDDPVFLANYADGLTDVPLPTLEEFFRSQGRIASFLSVRPPQSFHVVDIDPSGAVSRIQDVGRASMLINGGNFIFKREIFDYIREGEELVVQPFQRLISQGQLASYRYDGFWACMDTWKEKQILDEMYERGNTPWQVWEKARPGQALKAG
jgi:glucose-1-phosphate cytidylyltransferase